MCLPAKRKWPWTVSYLLMIPGRQMGSLFTLALRCRIQLLSLWRDVLFLISWRICCLSNSASEGAWSFLELLCEKLVVPIRSEYLLLPKFKTNQKLQCKYTRNVSGWASKTAQLPTQHYTSVLTPSISGRETSVGEQTAASCLLFLEIPVPRAEAPMGCACKHTSSALIEGLLQRVCGESGNFPLHIFSVPPQGGKSPHKCTHL